MSSSTTVFTKRMGRVFLAGTILGGWSAPILAQAAAAPQPSQRALDDPASGQHHEPHLVLGVAHNLQRKAVLLPKPSREFRAGISLVRPQVLQRRPVVAGAPQHPTRALALIHVRRMHHHRQQPPLRVHHQVPLATTHLFSPRPSRARRQLRCS